MTDGNLRTEPGLLSFSIPALTLFVVLLIIPVAIVILLSFTNYEFGALRYSWIGIKNYSAILNDAEFRRSLWNTLQYVLLVVPLSVALGLALAILINGLRRGQALYQCLFFLPVTTTLIAMATVWKFLLHDSIGPVNHLFRALGMSGIAFFGNPDWVIFALALIGIWSLAGFNMVLFLAGLTAIPQDIQDAAKLDGVHQWQDRLFSITLPLLGPTMLFVIITSSITAFKVFDTVAVLTRGGPQGASDVLLYSIYLQAFQYMRSGYASAMTVVFLIVLLLFAWLQARYIERKVHYQ